PRVAPREQRRPAWRPGGYPKLVGGALICSLAPRASPTMNTSNRADAPAASWGSTPRPAATTLPPRRATPNSTRLLWAIEERLLTIPFATSPLAGSSLRRAPVVVRLGAFAESAGA